MINTEIPNDRIRCYNQKKDEVRYIKRQIVESGNAKAQGFEVQSEPEDLPNVMVDVAPRQVTKPVQAAVNTDEPATEKPQRKTTKNKKS